MTSEQAIVTSGTPLAPAPVEPGALPSPALFDVPDAARLPRLVAELRRLGAGAISVRWPARAPSRRAFLLVESPPFHSVLRGEPIVYYEQVSRVWVEIGWRHPRGESIDLPNDQIALLRAPNRCEFVPDGPFESGPEEFPLHERPTAADVDAAVTFPVEVRLVADSSADPPELWVLHGEPFEQLRALAEEMDDRELARLSVAVALHDGRRVAVLRARPGRPGTHEVGRPPVLVLDALPCRPVLRLPNLFVPVGTRLRPPLRRDVVRKLLAPDADAIVWLEPTAGGDFGVHRLPESAFRPLQELVAYALDHVPQTLTPAACESPFPLPAFVTAERSLPVKHVRPKAVPKPVSPAEPDPSSDQPSLLSRIVRWFTPRHADSAHAASVPAVVDEPPRPLDPRAGQRRDLEQRLWAAVNSPPGAASPPWPELARLNAEVNRPGDAAVCWINALWESDEPSPQWWTGWLHAETRAEPGVEMRRWLNDLPTPAAVRAVAATIAGPSPPAAPLDRVRRLVEEHEDWLPVRAAWLAQLGLSRLSGGDAVGLARARDRLLVRLHDRGLSPDLELPSALRFVKGGAEHAEKVREWLARAREPIRRWLADPASKAAEPTRAYADLILAWGLARLGERATCEGLLADARGALAPLDEAHTFLLDAFAFRIGQALNGRAGGPLPADLFARLAAIHDSERTDRAARERLLLVKVQHLLQHSRILEPAERIDAFREGWLDPHAETGHSLAGLRYITDRDRLADRLLPVVASGGDDPTVLATALDLATRFGESLAGGLLDRLLAAVEGWTFAGPLERVSAEVTALERGLFVAAHFDRAAAVSRLSESLGRLLDAAGRGDVQVRPVEEPLLNLIDQSLRVMRRLGLRREADRLVGQLGRRVLRSGSPITPIKLRRLLTLAGGWFYLGRDGPAIEVLDEARRRLFSQVPLAVSERRELTELACAYAATLGRAPARLASDGVRELFTRLPGVGDDLVTNTHFSLAKLRVVEEAVRAVVVDDFSLTPAVRRWLDDDEYRIRRRIHRDTRAQIGCG